MNRRSFIASAAAILAGGEAAAQALITAPVPVAAEAPVAVPPTAWAEHYEAVLGERAQNILSQLQADAMVDTAEQPFHARG